MARGAAPGSRFELSSLLASLDRLPAATPQRFSRPLWLVALVALVVGLVGWASGVFGALVVALWCFVVAAAALALVLPLPFALVSPLYAGVLGWLVNMLPLTVLVPWAAVVARWAWGLVKERRLPRGGRFIWLPIGLAAWTALGVVVISAADLKHFLLLVAIQVLISGTILAVVDQYDRVEAWRRLTTGLIGFVVLLSVAVLLQWLGVPVESLQNDDIRVRVEEAYGVDAFPNNVGMVKYTWSTKSGAAELRRELTRAQRSITGMPEFEVFRPKFGAYDNLLVVRFAGSARPVEDELERFDIDLIYDNVGVTPAQTVPRLRSFPRNALTYAGVCAALFPLAFFLAWGGAGWRRRLGYLGVAASLFGAGFSLARGSWAAIAIGIVYLFVDAPLPWRRKLQLLGAYVGAAAVLTSVFLVNYDVDPLHARAGGEGSIGTRQVLYQATVASVNGLHLALGYGTEKPRTESGVSHQAGRYIPRAGTHSTYLNYLFRTGVVGALAIIALYATAALHARTAAREREGAERWFKSLAATSVVIAAAHGVILSLYVEPIYTLSISLVLGLALAGTLGLRSSVLPWRRETAG